MYILSEEGIRWPGVARLTKGLSGAVVDNTENANWFCFVSSTVTRNKVIITKLIMKTFIAHFAPLGK